MIRSFTLLVLVLFLTIGTYATAQYPDKIYFEGKLYKLHSNPMEAYFEKNPNKKPKTNVVSSALWRGYIATFEIADGSLYLKDVEVFAERSNGYGFKSVIRDVVPVGERLNIDWFTGLLVLPQGEVVNYVHMGYGSTYEKYTLLEIVAGEYKRSKHFNYKEYDAFKQRQFDAFKKTAEYNELIQKMKREGDYDEKFMESFLRSYITNYTSKILVD